MTSLLSVATIQSVVEFFRQGGFFMVLLMICSVVSLAVILLRGIALRRKTVMPPFIEQQIDELQPTDDGSSVVKLARLVRGDPSPLARIVQVGLQHLRWPKSENIEAVQTRARHELVCLEGGLEVLGGIDGIAPPPGTLGAGPDSVAGCRSIGQPV